MTRLRSAAFDTLARTDRRTIIAITAATVAMLALATAVTVLDSGEHPWLGLDGEHALHWPPGGSSIVVPTLWSGVLLALAGLGWLAISSRWPDRSRWWLPASLGVFLIFVAIDDNLFVHERLEFRLGIDWQTLYAPVIALMAAVLLLMLRRLYAIDPGAMVLLLAGSSLAAGAQLLEWLQWDGDERAANYVLMMVPEEIAETIAALLLGLAAVRCAWALASREPPKPDATQG
jgi:hypothetical protein